MKNLFKLLGIAALVAVIGFTMAACDNGGGGGGITPTPTPAVYAGVGDGDTYRLEITKPSGRAVYTPQKGDTYVLIINFGQYRSTGTIIDFKDGVFTLKA